MIARLLRSALPVVALAALAGCASAPYVTTTEFQSRPKPEELICSVDSVAIYVSAGEGLALEKSFLSRMESGIREAIYKRKKFSPCAIFVPRRLALNLKITKLTENGDLAALLSPTIDTVLFDGDVTLGKVATPKNETLAGFTMKNSFAWGCPIKDSHFLWGLFASTNGQGGECGSATALDIMEDTFAEELAKVVVVTPVPPSSMAASDDRPAGGKPDAKPDKDKGK